MRFWSRWLAAAGLLRSSVEGDFYDSGRAAAEPGAIANAVTRIHQALDPRERSAFYGELVTSGWLPSGTDAGYWANERFSGDPGDNLAHVAQAVEGGAGTARPTTTTQPAAPAPAPPTTAAPAPPPPKPPAPPPPRLPPPPAKPQRDWLTEARLENPGIPDELLLAYRDQYLRFSGNGPLAWAAVRQTEAYERYFPGNRRPDGSVRMDEQIYLSQVEAYEEFAFAKGLNPARIRDQIPDMIRQNKSPEEFGEQLATIEREIIDRPDVAAAWGEYFVQQGLAAPTPAVLLAMALDPTLEDDLLDRRIRAAEIGAEAARFGFRRSLGRANELRQFGVTQETARAVYQRAARDLSTLSTLTARHGEGPLSLRDFEDAFVFGDDQDQRRLERAARAEQSTFRSRRSRQRAGGLLAGLEPF